MCVRGLRPTVAAYTSFGKCALVPSLQTAVREVRVGRTLK